MPDGAELTSDGSIVAWGSNDYGECNVPEPNAGFVTQAAGGYHSVGVKGDGSIVGWGENSYGQRDAPAPNGGFVAVAGGDDLEAGREACAREAGTYRGRRVPGQVERDREGGDAGGRLTS